MSAPIPSKLIPIGGGATGKNAPVEFVVVMDAPVAIARDAPEAKVIW
jgi:hypothetical protein